MLRPLKQWMRRRTLKRLIATYKTLPEPHTIKALQKWKQWIEHWKSNIHFTRYASHRGQSTACRTRYNNASELFDDIGRLKRAMNTRGPLVFQTIEYRPQREANFDYFLTNAQGHPLDPSGVFNLLIQDINEIVTLGQDIQQTMEASVFSYYEHRAAALFEDVISIVSLLIVVSDLND